MSIATFLGNLKAEAVKFGNVIIKDEQAAVAWAEGVFGKTNVDNAIASVEAAAQTDLGKLTKEAVLFAENLIGSGNGSAKASLVLSIASTAASALGIPFSTSAINALINLFAGFLASKASAAVGSILKPAQ